MTQRWVINFKKKKKKKIAEDEIKDTSAIWLIN